MAEDKDPFADLTDADIVVGNNKDPFSDLTEQDIVKKKGQSQPTSPTGGKVGASETPSIGSSSYQEALGIKKPTAPTPLVTPFQQKAIKPVAQKDENLRPDGTKKDIGFLGEFKTPSGKSVTEYSIGVPINGKEMDIPTLVPTLTEEEKKYIIDKAEKEEQIGRDAIGNSIVKKSIAHAEQRIKEGKSPFFSSSEKTKEDSKTAFEKYNLSYQKYKLDNDTFENALDITATNKLTLGEQASDFLGDIFKYARVPSMEEALKGNKYEQAKKEALSDSYIKKLSENLGKSKQDYILSTKELDKTIKKQSEEIAKSLGGWDKLVREDGDADVDKIRDGVDSYFEKIGIPTDSPAAYKLRSEIKGQAEFKKIEPKINDSFDKEYYKLFGTTPESDLKTEYALTIENAKELKNIKANLDKQREIENSALKNEYQPEYEELGALYKTKTSEIELAIENDTEINSYAESLQNEKLKELQAAVDANKITVEQANQELNSPKQKEFLKAEVLKRINEKYSKVYENAFVDYQKQINEVASRYKSAYRIQENKRVEEANKKIEEEVKRLGGQYKVSDKIIERRKKAYVEAYKNVSTEQGAAKLAAARGLNFLSQAGASLLMGLGGGLKGYGAEFDNKTLYDIGESLESNFTINVGESKEFSDWLDSNKLIVGSGNIIGRMIPGIGLTAGAAYLTKNWGLTSRLATTAVVGWSAETADMAGTIKNEVFEKTQDPVIAENAAKDMWRSQVYLLPLYGLEGAPYISEFYTQLGKKIAPKIFAETAKGARKTLGQWAKETAVKTLAGGVGETITEIAQEFPQNINEEAIRNGKEIKGIVDQIDVYNEGATLPKLKETIVQVAPSTLLMGGTPVFVSSAYNKAKSSYYERSVDNYLNSASISASLETSPEQYLFNINREKGKNFTGTLLNTLFTSGKISESEFDRLSEKMVNMEAYNEVVKKAKAKGTEIGNLVGYRLYDQYVSATQAYESEKDELAKEVLKKQADEAKAQFVNLLQGKGANVSVMTLSNGQQYAFLPDEMMFALQFPNIRESIKNGDIGVVVGGDKAVVGDLLKELESLEQEPQATQQPSQPIITKNTTPTDEKYGTIDRGDGKGVIDLTKAEYEAEIAKQQPAAPATAQEVVEETPAFETDKTEAAQPIELAVEETPTPSVEPSQEERKQSGIPTGNYEIAQEATRVVSEENPDASVLLTPKGEDLSLTAVFVKNEKRNKGIGTKVLESVKRQADRLGKKVVLDATTELDEETDLERLGNFYERNGFEKIGENKYQYTPKGQEEVIPALKDVESAAKALEDVNNSNLSEANKIIKTVEIIAPIIETLPNEKKLELAELTGERSNAIKKNKIAAEYAKAKVKPESEQTAQEKELTKAVEQLLTSNKPQNEQKTKIGERGTLQEPNQQVGETGQVQGVSEENRGISGDESLRQSQDAENGTSGQEENVTEQGGVTAPSLTNAATPQESGVGASLRDVELKMRRPESNEVIFVSVDALLQKHAKDQPSYDIQKEENRIKGRVEKAKEFIKNYIKDQRAINPKTGERMNTKVSFEPSVVDIDANGKISFEDGRHRVLAAKELGITEVPIEVPKERVKAVEQLLSKPNEKITQKENGKPLPEGVSGIRTETEERKTSPELRPKEEEVRSIIDNAVANFYAINEATKRSEKREAAKEYRQNLEKMPTVKNIFDNIKTIFAQLEAEGVITKSKDCP